MICLKDASLSTSVHEPSAANEAPSGPHQKAPIICGCYLSSAARNDDPDMRRFHTTVKPERCDDHMKRSIPDSLRVPALLSKHTCTIYDPSWQGVSRSRRSAGLGSRQAADFLTLGLYSELYHIHVKQYIPLRQNKSGFVLLNNFTRLHHPDHVAVLNHSIIWHPSKPSPLASNRPIKSPLLLPLPHPTSYPT